MVRLATRKRSISPVGLDIGFSGVRGVQLQADGDGFRPIRQARFERNMPNPDSLPDDDEIERRVRACFATGDFLGRTSVTALTTPNIEYHAVEFPSAVLSQDPQRLHAVVRQEMQRLMHPSDARVQTAFWRLPPAGASAPNVIGTIAHDDCVARSLAACGRANVDCACIDAGATALSRFGCMMMERGDGDVWGVLDLGLLESRLVICFGAVPVLVRTAGNGGAAWTSRIAEALEVSSKAAETHKRQHGLTIPSDEDGADGGDAVQTELGSMLFGALRSDLTSLTAEIKRSFEYVLGCYPGSTISDLILAGGGALTRNLDEFLSFELGILVARAGAYVERDGCRLYWAGNGTGTVEELAGAIGLAISESK